MKELLVWGFLHLNIIPCLSLQGDLCQVLLVIFQDYDDVKLANMFKRAERKGAEFAIIIGEDEVNKEEVVIKNLKTTEQKSCPLEKLVEVISEEMGDYCDGENCK